MTIFKSVVKQVFDFVNYDAKTGVLRVRNGEGFKDFSFIEGEEREKLANLVKSKAVNIDDEISILATKRKSKNYGNNYVATHFLGAREGKQLNLENFL